MQAKRKLITVTAVLMFALLAAASSVVQAQENGERIAHSNGQGTLQVGDEKFKLNAVVVKLIDDHTVELTLVSDITVFLSGTWSTKGESPQEIDLDMSGSASRGGLDGTGKVVLGNDGKSVVRLRLKGISRATKREIEASFEGK